MKFLDRESEMEALEKAYAAGGFVPVYGRRRVGKTRLIEEFMEDKPGVYYLAATENGDIRPRYGLPFEGNPAPCPAVYDDVLCLEIYFSIGSSKRHVFKVGQAVSYER
ncbi:MAG: hypothetical protein MAG715_00171 [Methanonatronarchaeales archaeon]|nr:hypothetical protein [Methanonatronarchaeales archaeon]